MLNFWTYCTQDFASFSQVVLLKQLKPQDIKKYLKILPISVIEGVERNFLETIAMGNSSISQIQENYQN